ncbi:phosphotransferase family protein [Stipitochalara longipes BDJ]|nr:phosphotransferase family protein [Stipitochalara longipes BDJ]
MNPPSPEIINAFGLSGTPKPLPGGRGLCYLVGETVFKPADDDTEAQWLSELATKLLIRSSASYRLSKPLAVFGQPCTFVFDRWTASSFLPGATEQSGNFEEILQVSRAFHADLAEVIYEKPVAIAGRSNRWCEADAVTWEEKKLEDVPDVDQEILAQLDPILKKLVLARKSLPESVKPQLIHADLAGNVLFQADPREPPAIIDLTLYWRPARYAEAIIVADGLTWDGKGHGLIQFYGMDELGKQMLLRALYWRCLTWAIEPDHEWVREGVANTVQRYRKATEIVLEFYGI